MLDALLVAGQTTSADLISIVHADRTRTTAALQRLLDLALAWEAPGGVRALTGVADAMRGMPGLVSGLRPASPEAASPDALAARIAELSPAATALLRHVDDHGGEGTTGIGPAHRLAGRSTHAGRGADQPPPARPPRG